MGFRKIISLVLVLFLSIQQLVFAAGTTTDVTSQNMIDNYLIISSSETWGQSKTVTQNVIVAPDATLTIGYGVDIQFQGNLIIYGKVQNNGRIYMNKHDVIANYVNMGGIKMWGDTNFPNNGIFDPYGSTTDVGCLCTPYKDTYPYPVPPIEVTSPMNLSTVSKSPLPVKGRTVPGFKVDINGQQTTANQDGTFSLDIDLVLGENSLPVVITDTFARVHHVEDLLVTYVKDEEVPVAPTVDPFDDTLTAMTGSGESGSTITVKNAVGMVGETKVGSDGRFSVEIGKQTVGEILYITATDEAGNVSEPTQVIVQDKTGPTIQSFSPADQAVKTPINTSIRMSFNEDIQDGANFNKIEVLKSTGENVEVEKVISGKVLEFKPLAKLDYSTTYTVKVPVGGIKDSSGNENKEAFEFSFQTEEFSTRFSGGIYEDTTWTKDKSPYLVTGDVVVFPDTTLTIEPGVTVKFMSDTGMSIRGKLKSEGTESEKITFTSEDQNMYWDGIQVDPQLGGTASFTQTNISHAHNGVSVLPDYTNQAISVTVDSSTFEGNQTGITSSYPVISINHSTFKNNTTGVNGSFNRIVDSSFADNEYGASINLDGYVYHSDFTNNHYGITGMANVYKSTFTGNVTALSLSNGNLRFNRIEDNQIGLEMTGSFTVSSNEFIHNQTGIDLFGTSSETIKSNTLNNQMWNVKNHTKFSKDLSQNYWGTTDEAVIKEKIYDGYDNVNNGLVTYKPFLTETVNLVDQKVPVWTEGTTYVNSSLIEENGTKKIRTYWGGTATDDMSVKNYNVYVDGTLVGTAPGTWSSGLYDFEFAKYPPGDYSFKVEAVDFEGNISSNGPSATITIPDIEDPVWPAGSEIHVVKKDATSVTLEWTPAIDNVKVHEYILTLNKNSNHIIPGDQTSYTITNLKPWETYFIQVHASDELWNMAYSGGSVDDPSVSVTLEDHNPPKWPDDGVVTASNQTETSVHLDWPDASDEEVVDHYEIYINGEYVTSSVESSYDVSGLSSNKEYTFSVKAKDRTGGNVSEPLSLTWKTPDYSAPYWDTGSTLILSDISDTSVKLSWPAAKDRGGITHYRIKQNGQVIETMGADVTSYLVTGLSINTDYYFTVEAQDTSGNWSEGGLQQSLLIKDTKAPMWSVVDVLAADQITETEVHLSWQAAEDNMGVTNYRIRQNGTIIGFVDAMTTNYWVNGLTGNTEYEFTVEAGDSADNWSSTGLTKVVKTKDLTAPAAPIVYEVTEQSTSITGTAEAGSTLSVKAGVSEIGSGIVGADGRFGLEIAKQKAGTVLEVTATDAAGNTSAISRITVIDATAPEAPTVSQVTDQSLRVAGIAEVGSVITVKVGETEIGTGSVGFDGRFSIEIPQQTAGTILEVFATDGAGHKSTISKVTVVDVTAPVQPVVNDVTDQSLRVSGTAETGTVITVKIGDTIIGSSVVGDEGKYEVEIPMPIAGTVIDVFATDGAGNVSAVVKKTVKDVTPPNEPLLQKITDQSTEVKGTAEPGSFIRVLANGMEIGTATTKVDGTFTVSIQKQQSTVTIEVIATDAAGNSSKVAMTSVQDVTPPAKPVVKEVTDRDTSVTGQTEPWVMVQINAGTVNWTAPADGNGKFLVSIPVQKAGTQLVVTAMDAAGNVSEKATVVVVDVSSEKPMVEEVTDRDTAVLGAAEAGASVVVKANDELIGKGSVGENGRFSIGIPVQKAGTKLEVSAIDQAGNVSDVTTVVVKDGTPPSKPMVNEVNDKNAAVTGEAEAGAQIVVKVNGTVIGRDVVGEDGKFRLVFALLEAGTKLVITCVDEAGNVSEEAEVVVKDITAPLNPWVGEVTDVDTTVFGEAEAGAKVQVKVNGTVIGEGSVGSDGKFAVKLSGAQKADTQLTITAIDAAGNESGSATIVVKDVTVPAKPVVNEVTDKDLSVSGQAEAGAKVEVRVSDSVIGTTQASAGGEFTVVIPVQKSGTELIITAIDRAGNESPASKVTVKDATPPGKPKVNEVTDKDTSVTGQAEAGSKVEILVNGSVVGTGHADNSGEFTVSIPVQKAGTELFIRSTDLIGNVGEAISVVVRDVTSPEKPTVNEVSNKDSVVSGEAEAGAKIEVLSNGGVLGTATVAADGKFVVTIMAQAAGTELEVTATDSQGNQSLTTKMVVKDRIAPKAPVVNQVTDEEFVIKGTAEPGSLISVMYHGSVLGTGTAGKEGGFAVEIPVPGSPGTEFTVTAKDEWGNESQETKYIVISSKKGWIKKGTNWYYYDSKTGLPVTGWLMYSKKWYYLGEYGLMKTGWLLDKNRWYYLDGSGVMKTGWLKSGSKWYYLDGSSGAMRTGWLKSGSFWYYLDSSGAMKTGWLKDGSAWYYLDSGGVMKTGWVTIAGKRYYFNTKGVWVK